MAEHHIRGTQHSIEPGFGILLSNASFYFSTCQFWHRYRRSTSDTEQALRAFQNLMRNTPSDAVRSRVQRLLSAIDAKGV